MAKKNNVLAISISLGSLLTALTIFAHAFIFVGEVKSTMQEHGKKLDKIYAILMPDELPISGDLT